MSHPSACRRRLPSWADGDALDRMIAEARDAELAWAEGIREVVGLAPPMRMTEAGKRRFRRDQMIAALSIAGFSQRRIASVFGVAHSRVAAIVGEIGHRTGDAARNH